MNLTISGNHLEITPALHDYVTKKFQRIKRHFEQIIEARIVLGIKNQKEKDKRHHAECTLQIKGPDIRAESSDQDMYAAIDAMVDKLDRQIIRHKDKLQHHAAAGQRLDHSAAEAE